MNLESFVYEYYVMSTHSKHSTSLRYQKKEGEKKKAMEFYVLVSLDFKEGVKEEGSANIHI